MYPPTMVLYIAYALWVLGQFSSHTCDKAWRSRNTEYNDLVLWQKLTPYST